MSERPVTVRPATKDDVPGLVALFRDVAGERRWIGTEPGFDEEDRAQRMRATVTDGPGTIFVALAGDELVGQVGVIPASYGVADLGMMVASGWRGAGVGRALLDAAIEWARAEPAVHKVALQHWPHNLAAHRLYQGAGFSVEGRLRRHYRRASGEVWDAIVMGLVVDPSVPGSSIPDDIEGGPREP